MQRALKMLFLYFFPYFGIGAGFNILHIRKNKLAISNLLASNESNSFLWQVTGILDLGLGSELKHFSKKDKNSGAAIGLREGYLVDLHKNKKWISDGVNVTGLPSISQSGPYIRLIVGGWGGKRTCASVSNPK